MITDKLENAAKYHGIGELYQKGLNWLATADLPNLTAGRHEIDGERLFALVQEYDTKPPSDCKWESHKLYADIQYIIAGRELMGYAPVEALTDAADHTPGKDVINYRDGNGAGVHFSAKTGDFFIFLPQDGHQPNVMDGEKTNNKKAVVKILV
jgi:YhcH/YjgK/YiaL family protein